MNIAYDWLTQYVKIPCDLKTLCDKLTTAGIEVEAVERKGSVPAGVVTAKILSREPHPGSDHLSICKVTDGAEELQIVCGAPNCDAGKIVPLAKIGTTFVTAEGEFKIKRSKLRGVESFGMMCSAKELGISEDNDGLMILPEDTALGKAVADLYPGDAAIEVEVTPNRPDWLSHFGIARDVACLLHTQAVLPEIPASVPAAPEKAENLVTVEAPDLCWYYTARIVRGVTVKESPDWLKQRLTSVGLRPINNVVDVTNFVLMELGQPLHAFDLARLAENRIVVRRAREGESIVTLDGKNLKLANRHLVICDAEKPMALAGVMGGEFSGVTGTTTDVLLESAVFQPSNVRATSRELGISSDASYRYERGVDYDMCDVASDRAIALILELAGGKLVTERVAVRSFRPEKPVIPCRFERIRSLTGIPLDNAAIVDVFVRLGLEVRDVTDVSCVVTAPLFRLDLSREADLAEEVARINGLDTVPVIPVRAVAPSSITEDAYYARQMLREDLLSFGLMECLHYGMVDDRSAAADPRFEAADLFRIGNPLSLDLATLRPSLMGEMLYTVERNVSRQNTDLRLFELERAFCKNPAKFPEERQALNVILTGRRHPDRFSAELAEEYDFFDLKGLVESLFEKRRMASVTFAPVEDARFAPGMALEVRLDGKAIGALGELNHRYTKGWRTPHKVFMAELEVAPILGAKTRSIYLEPVSIFPATTRDVAFLKPAALTHREIMEFIGRAGLKNLEKVQIFDRFADAEKLGANRESVAYRLTFRAKDRTLTDDEVNKAFDRLREKLSKGLGLELR